ncbi:MAG: hypothetical protein WCT77_14190 [Bacteroidota bacterium]
MNKFKNEIGTYRILANQIGEYIEAPISLNSGEFVTCEKKFIIGVRHNSDVLYYAKDFDKDAKLVMFSDFDSAMNLRNELDKLTKTHRYYVVSIIVDDYSN